MSEINPIELQQIPTAWLQQIAAGRLPTSPQLGIVEGALPPPHVAKRALAHLARGDERLWCVPFNIVSINPRQIVGGCGFKGAPSARVVEIGYGVAPACWQRGYARSGVSRLLELGAATGEIDAVIAHIAPDNSASSALAQRLGFSADGGLMEVDNEQMVRWRRDLR